MTAFLFRQDKFLLGRREKHRQKQIDVRLQWNDNARVGSIVAPEFRGCPYLTSAPRHRRKRSVIPERARRFSRNVMKSCEPSTVPGRDARAGIAVAFSNQIGRKSCSIAVHF